MNTEVTEKEPPKVLTIAGSDCSGGAGIQADLKTFTLKKVYGASVVTCITSQNQNGVSDIYELPRDVISNQLRALLSSVDFSSIKTGMLCSTEILEVVISELKGFNGFLIVDPVLKSTSGSILLNAGAISLYKKSFLSRASLVTPNIYEASILLNVDEKLLSNDLKDAARRLVDEIGAPILLKGGHLAGNECVDTFYDGQELVQFTHEKHQTQNTHGTGCTLSASIAAELARGRSLLSSVESSIKSLQLAIASADSLKLYNSGYGPVNHLAID